MTLKVSPVDLCRYDGQQHDQDRRGSESMVREWHKIVFNKYKSYE